MWKWAVVLASCCVAAAPVLAGPNAGGTLVVHDAGLSVSATNALEPVCGQGNIPASCVSIDTRIDGSGPADPRIWKIYAAFPASSSPRLIGITFGVSYNSSLLTVSSEPTWNCGDFELPDTNWPASGTGNSVVWDYAQTGLLVPVYAFSGYALGPVTFTATPNPEGGGVFGDDSVPAQLDYIAGYGRLGFDMDGATYCPDPGACCLPDGSCRLWNQAPCSAAGDIYQGDGSVCDPSPCPPAGACCVSDGSCRMLAADPCLSQGGTYGGAGTSCTPNPCPQPPTGACCLWHGSCSVTTEAGCSGVYQGDGTACEPDLCPPAGACCFVTGYCDAVTGNYCSDHGGTYQGDGTACDPNPCPPPPTGACCTLNRFCYLVTNHVCGGLVQVYLGDGTTCEPNQCPQTGACCLSSTWCELSMAASCTVYGGAGSIYLGDGTICTPNPCSQPRGACCTPEGVCTITPASSCPAPGQWLGASVSCTPNPCPVPVPVEQTTWGRVKARFR